MHSGPLRQSHRYGGNIGIVEKKMETAGVIGLVQGIGIIGCIYIYICIEVILG